MLEARSKAGPEVASGGCAVCGKGCRPWAGGWRCTGPKERNVVTVSALGSLVPRLPSACDAHFSSASTAGWPPGHIPSWPKGGDTTAWRGDPSLVPRRCGVRRRCHGSQAHPAPWGGERASWGPWIWQTSRHKLCRCGKSGPGQSWPCLCLRRPVQGPGPAPGKAGPAGPLSPHALLAGAGDGALPGWGI